MEKPGSAPVSQRAQHVECPICMQSFPQNRIEMHAAYCDGTRESEEVVVEEEEETASQGKTAGLRGNNISHEGGIDNIFSISLVA